MGNQLQTATFGGGCFWCIESAMKQLEGVISVQSGYSGGEVENPTYQQVCSGITGHAEVVQVVFDAHTISYRELLEVLFTIHDPTQLNRQGNDVGTQYRSVIFYHNEEQLEVAKAFLQEVTVEEIFEQPVVTELSPFMNWYAAEAYHANYYENNTEQPYCMAVIAPKLAKFRATFASKLKSSPLVSQAN
ncbi:MULTISPECIES: peptide-methionine (S)-S-oxide reductase MsrA [Gammaproteobacteria]|uniref:peptide-methionine (S)-S-oxide reductase MsrA n=1 Tax=Gammaproteobacteria TaxID=1236 RepID=UPI000DD02ACB|nr:MULTISPECIES: peptide-methionine (S)-S-oxide reductase MsrA [Gammaproteobacteria]RTE86216.1 peptide-methionine (S)-S-oxide reductase [Aliidiomarina sp. B3213]TCZ91773.1 peptide-methionine (S)-S-oxide reductase [Lysobacter sp. N42]